MPKSIKGASALVFENTPLDPVTHNGQTWLIAPQIGAAMGYTTKVMMRGIYAPIAERFTPEMTAKVKLSSEIQALSGLKKARIFSLSGAFLLATSIHTEQAVRFASWLKSILDSETPTLSPHGAPVARIKPQTVREDRRIYRALKILENRLKVPGQAIPSTRHAHDYLRLSLADLEREVFVCMFLDGQNRVVGIETLFHGTLTQTAVHPREIVKRSLHHNAAAVIFAHNHPSGVASPSAADMVLTCELINTLKLIDVRVLEHFIIAGLDALSFAARGILGSRELPEVKEEQTPAEPPKRKRKTNGGPANRAPTTVIHCPSS